jgi:hypothetical protein
MHPSTTSNPEPASSCRCEVLSYPTSGPDEVLVTCAFGLVGGEDGRIERLG